MNRIRIFLAISVCAVLATSSALAKGPFGSIHVGQWNGGAYTHDNTGAFSHCAAGAQYLNGTFLVVAQNADGGWTLGFANPAFRLTAGQTFPVDATFDGQSHIRLFATALTAKMLLMSLPDSTLSVLRKSSLMVAEALGSTIQFKLTGSGTVIPIIAHCVAKTKAAGVTNVGDFTLPVVNPPATKQTVASNTEQGKPAKPTVQNGTGFVVSANGHIVTAAT